MSDTAWENEYIWNFAISKCIEGCEESCTSVKWSLLIAIKFQAMSQMRIKLQSFIRIT